MARVNAKTLCPGMRLTHGLYTAQGIKLLGAGTLLTREMCRAITASAWGGLYFASSSMELHRRTDEADRAEAATGGNGRIAPDQVEPGLRAVRRRIAEQCVADLRAEWDRIPRRIEPSASAWPEPPDPRAPRTPWPEEHRLGSFRAERVERCRRILSRIVAGLPVQAGEAGAIVAELIHLNRQRPERFTQLALFEPGQGEDLAEHCYATACLSVAIASRMGWVGRDVRLAGLAGLLADVGMAFVPENLRRHSRPLTEVEVNRVRRHPVYSAAMLEAVDGLPAAVRLAAYQHHERENGSGYPRGARSREICDVARVAAAADAFAASAGRRRYRSHKKPHEAMEEMIMLASAGVFDKRVVRALVESAGLFPVGSWVRLSNGRPAMVVGASPGAVDRPVVRMLERTAAGEAMGLTVRLADFDRADLRVERAIDPPESPALARSAVSA